MDWVVGGRRHADAELVAVPLGLILRTSFFSVRSRQWALRHLPIYVHSTNRSNQREIRFGYVNTVFLLYNIIRSDYLVPTGQLLENRARGKYLQEKKRKKVSETRHD